MHQLSLQLVQLLDQTLTGFPNFISSRLIRDSLDHVLHLPADVANPHNGLVDRVHTLVDAGEEFFRGLVIGGGHLKPRIPHNLEGAGLRHVAHAEPHLIRARPGTSAVHAAESDESRDAGDSLVAQVPDRPVLPGFDFEWPRSTAISLRLLAGIGADHLALAVQDLQADRGLGRLRHIEVDRRAGGRVLTLPWRPLVASGSTAPAAPTEPIGSLRCEQVNGGVRDITVDLLQWCEVVEDPEGAALGRGDEIVVLDLEVGDGDGGQVKPQRLPALAVVERNVHSGLGARVEQTSADRVLAHDTDPGFIGYAANDPLPATAVVRRSIYVRREVVELVAGDGDVRGRRVVWRGFDRVHHRFADSPRCHVRPIGAAVAGDVH